MLNNKLSLVMGVLFIFLASSAIATTTFVTPEDSATINGATYTVNITSDIGDLLNCSFLASSALTGDALATTLAYNESAAATNVNISIDTTALEDANDWILSGTCYNATANEAIASRTGITIDNTIPQAPTSLSPTSFSDGQSITSWSATVTGVNTTSCTMYITDQYGSLITHVMTHTGDECTSSQDITLGPGSSWYITATDETNSTDSAVTSFDVEKSGGGAAAYAYQQEQARSEEVGDTEGKNNTVLFILGIVAIFLIFGGKKKK